VAGAEQSQRWPAAEVEGGREGRMRKTSSAAEESRSSAAGPVSTRRRAGEVALDGSAIGGGGVNPQIGWNVVPCA
jgi:hypothetical protein